MRRRFNFDDQEVARRAARVHRRLTWRATVFVHRDLEGQPLLTRTRQKLFLDLIQTGVFELFPVRTELYSLSRHYKGERISLSMPQVGPNQPIGDPVALAAMTDERLMLLFRLGNSDAFSELFRRFSGPVYGFFRRRLENPSRAEELAQETFVAVLRGVERYEPRATFRAYLYGIAMRILMAERRKSARPAPSASASAAPDPTADSCVDAAIWVHRAIDQLDPDHRDILLLREYEQLTYDEIAALLRLPVNTVRSRLFRARTALKAFLLPLRPEVRNEP